MLPTKATCCMQKGTSLFRSWMQLQMDMKIIMPHELAHSLLAPAP